MARGAARLEQELRKIIRGRDDVIRMALVAIFARGHLLIEGVPGVGKTTLAHALARSLDCSFQRVQFTSDLLPSDVLGISIYSPIEQKFEFKPGPVFANVLLADEINRTTPKTQSALLEAMNERQVTVDRGSYPLPEPFLVIATQNPVEHHGTYPLPESQMDRFLLRVAMTYPEAGSEREILRSEVGAAKLDELRPVLTAAEVSDMQQQVTRVRVDDSLADYALAIVNKTRESELPGVVKLIFQPAEEFEGGADMMVKDGLFDRCPMDKVYGLHNWPDAKAGTFLWRAGPVMAAVGFFDIVVTGLVALAERFVSQLTGPVKFTVVHGLVGQSAIALLMAHPAAVGAMTLSGTGLV